MYLEIAEIGVQNEAWRDRKSMKIMAWRVWEGLGAPLGIHGSMTESARWL